MNDDASLGGRLDAPGSVTSDPVDVEPAPAS
jgi:hypothetical protein